MSSMQKVLLGGALAVFLLCAGAGLFGYYRVLPWFREGMSDAIEAEVAYRVEESMANALVMHTQNPCAVHLAGHDLNISTYTDTSGSRSIDVVNDDATIVNGEVVVTSDGIEIYAADMHLHGVPDIQNGVFTLEDAEIDRSLAGLLFEGSALESGFEQGVNAGLRRAQLVPTSVQLEDGSMVMGCKASASLARSFTT
jgi:hypothetical protein